MKNAAVDIKGIERVAHGTVIDWLLLAKPGIVALTLTAALAGIYLGSWSSASGSGYLDLLNAFYALLGLGVATAGSAMLNNYIDRDIDKLMDRTSWRALPKEKVRPEAVLLTGIILVVASLVFLYAFVNPITSMFTAIGVLGYVVVYTLILKPRSSWANQMGGIAGAMPPVIGYAAATGAFDIYSAILFIIVALWQQPHAISLAMIYKNEYEKAGVPVVPVSRGIGGAKKRIFVYSIFLFFAALLPYYSGMAGRVYFVVAAALGAVFVAYSYLFMRSVKQKDKLLFDYSILYLTVVLAVMMVDMI